MTDAIFTHTEAKASDDANASSSFEEVIKKENKRRSIFNITLQNSAKEYKDAKFREHECKLNTEMREWTQILKKSKHRLRAARNATQRVDISLLPENKRAFLKQAPNLQKFIRESLEFRKAANVYLEHHLADALDVQENIRAISEYYLMTRKQEASSEMLANGENN